jgi:hypothetical protein
VRAQGDVVSVSRRKQRVVAQVVAAGTIVLLAGCSTPSSSSSSEPQASTASSSSSTQSASAWSPTPTETAAGIRTLDVAVHGDVVVVPSHLQAGTYVVTVSTSDADGATLQVARPGDRLTPQRFVDLQDAYYAAATPGRHDIELAFRRWRTSVTFLGGATAVPAQMTYGYARTPGGVGTFAVTLAPGRYWFYAGNAGEVLTGDNHPAAAAHIREVTVDGAPTDASAALPVTAEARFSPGTSTIPVQLPATIPGRGFLRGRGSPGVVSTLVLLPLLPGVTDAELTDGGTCIAGRSSGGIATKNCFGRRSTAFLAGVSGGQDALWFYDLPPGDYAAGQASGVNGVESQLFWGYVTRVTVT